MESCKEEPCNSSLSSSFLPPLLPLPSPHIAFPWPPQVKELSWSWEELKYALRVPNPERMTALYAAMKRGMSEREAFRLTAIDPWFLSQLGELMDCEDFMSKFENNLKGLTKEDIKQVRGRGRGEGGSEGKGGRVKGT